jgi:hypothetical protein
VFETLKGLSFLGSSGVQATLFRQHFFVFAIVRKIKFILFEKR